MSYQVDELFHVPMWAVVLVLLAVAALVTWRVRAANRDAAAVRNAAIRRRGNG